MNKKPQSNAIIGIISIVIISLIVGGVYVFKSGSDDDTATNTTMTDTASQPADSTTGSTPMMGSYKDGTYEATGNYNTPGGNEYIDVTIVIQNGKIIDSSVTSRAKSRESKGYQSDFVNGYKDQVKGKSIATLRLSRVAGSSLTPRGFNEAIDAIKTQATKS